MSLGRRHLALLAASAFAALVLSGCAAVPDRHVLPVYHNPFPQLHRVAVLPFFNQSTEPTVDGDAIAQAYFNELQAIQGFEVMPVGVARRLAEASRIRPQTGADFQQLARLMRVDAIIVGSITEYSPYYPPRMGISVDWYAANPGYHPIPAGYGLPWGTAEEEFIPSQLVKEAEFALAREQLKTQVPPYDERDFRAAPAENGGFSQPPSEQSKREVVKQASAERAISSTTARAISTSDAVIAGHGTPSPPWPDPRGFVPLAPSASPPPLRPQYEPLISHTRIYHGQNAEFTQRLEAYYQTRDDARFGGWETYLQRPSDFVRFCCYLHVTETLAARGGAGESQVAWRWPISR
jgi:hypothetical protein